MVRGAVMCWLKNANRSTRFSGVPWWCTVVWLSREISIITCSGVGRRSAVGILTRYRLDGPGIESRLGARFSAPVQTGPGSHPASYTMGTGSFLGVKQTGRGVDQSPPSSAEVKERVELYLCSLSGPSWPVLGWTLPLPLPAVGGGRLRLSSG